MVPSGRWPGTWYLRYLAEFNLMIGSSWVRAILKTDPEKLRTRNLRYYLILRILWHFFTIFLFFLLLEIAYQEILCSVVYSDCRVASDLSL